MRTHVRRFLLSLRPAFSRQAAHAWCMIAFLGLLLRSEALGVSSIVRALSLDPGCYHRRLHAFHAAAWSVQTLTARWWALVAASPRLFRHQGRLVLIGDHTKTPKDGRRMPAVVTLHQDSETASKPSFFRGHHWGLVAILTHAAGVFRATPLWAAIHAGTAEDRKTPKTVRLVRMAHTVLTTLRTEAYLVLDAFFAVGPVFMTAKKRGGLFVLTRAKANVVAFKPPPPRRKGQRGRPKVYGAKLRLMDRFDRKAWRSGAVSASAQVYDRRETVRYLVLDLLWKPVKGYIRFILVESSRGRMILMSSDLHLDPLAALELYCRRVPIEALFDALKNTFGAFAYHFWSKYLAPASRRPAANAGRVHVSSRPARTRRTRDAIEKFVNLQLVLLGFLQLLAFDFPQAVRSQARCWLRTVSGPIPSPLVTRLALVNCLAPFSRVSPACRISALFRPPKSLAYDKRVLDKRSG